MSRKVEYKTNARGVVTLDEGLGPATTHWQAVFDTLQTVCSPIHSDYSVADAIGHSVDENGVFKSFVCAGPEVDMSFVEIGSLKGSHLLSRVGLNVCLEPLFR